MRNYNLHKQWLFMDLPTTPAELNRFERYLEFEQKLLSGELHLVPDYQERKDDNDRH